MTHVPAPAAKGTAHGTKRTGSLRVLMVHWDGGGNGPPQRALISLSTMNQGQESTLRRCDPSCRTTKCFPQSTLSSRTQASEP